MPTPTSWQRRRYFLAYSRCSATAIRPTDLMGVVIPQKSGVAVRRRCGSSTRCRGRIAGRPLRVLAKILVKCLCLLCGNQLVRNKQGSNLESVSMELRYSGEPAKSLVVGNTARVMSVDKFADSVCHRTCRALFVKSRAAYVEYSCGVSLSDTRNLDRQAISIHCTNLINTEPGQRAIPDACIFGFKPFCPSFHSESRE